MALFHSDPLTVGSLSSKEQRHASMSYLDDRDDSRLPAFLDRIAKEITPELEYEHGISSSELLRAPSLNGSDLVPSASTGSYVSTVAKRSDYAAVVVPTISSDTSSTSKGNAAFHGLFPDVPMSDYLLHDYGCKLRGGTGVTIGGRLYLSKSYICFFSNLDKFKLVVPLHELTGLEKDTTVHNSNAIRIHTGTTAHIFTSFLQRDKTYDEIHSIWRKSHPKLELSSEGRINLEHSSTVNHRSTGYPVQPANITPLDESLSLLSTERQRETPVPQLARGSMTIAELLHKTSNYQQPPSVYTTASTYSTGSNPGSTNERLQSSVQANFTDSAFNTSQYPSEVTDILESYTPQHTASVMHECLVQHGCIDLTSSIDPLGFSSSAVAEGGLGDIWTGKFHNDGSKLAIKVLRFTLSTGDIARKELKRTAREIYNWSKLDHENIHKLMGVTLFRERLGMVSEWMENGNLRQYLNRNRGVDRHELVHGDLKAYNILVSSNGIIKITDFDYSIIKEHSLAFSTTTRVGGGTTRWMAPELLLEDNPPQRSMMTDIYALGMTLLEIITNNHPYPECGDIQILRKLGREEHPKRPVEFFPDDEWGSQMWSLLLQCWNFDPVARPTADGVLEVLMSIRKKV